MLPCDLCGSSSFQKLPQDPRIAVCLDCGFVYVPERRSAEEVAAAWDEIYRSEAYNPDWPGVKARLFYVAEWIDQTIGLEGKTVLDIGAGRGHFLRECRARGAYAVGLEPSTHNALGIRAEDFTCHVGTVESAGNIGQYDLVTINWTLENTADCIGMLRYARDRLAPGGHVVVATGSRILVPFKKPLSSYLNPKIPADLHCFRWSYRSLRRAFYKAGLFLDRANPWVESEWLVASACLKQPGIEFPFRHDTATKVLQHFADWEKMFP